MQPVQPDRLDRADRADRPAGRATGPSTARQGAFLALAALLLAIMLVVPPAALAGSASDPEVSDGDDTAGHDGVDLVAGWVEETASTVRLNVQLVDLQTGPAPLTQHNYAFAFRVGQTGYAAVAQASFGAETPAVDYWLADAQGDRVATLTGTYDAEASVISWQVPRDLLGEPAEGTVVADTWAEAVAMLGGTQAARDRAPDAGFGQSYTLQLGPAGSGGGTGGDGSGAGDGPGAPTDGGSSNLIAVGLVGVVAATGVIAWAVRARAGGVRLTCEMARRSTRAGQETTFPLRVKNRGRRPVTAQIRAGEVPKGWSAFVPLPSVKLDPGQSKDLWVSLRAPRDAAPGDAVDVAVQAQAKGASGQTSEVQMHAEVEGGGEPAPERSGPGPRGRRPAS